MAEPSWWERTKLYWDIVDPSALGHYRRVSRPVHGWLSRPEEAVLFQLARRARADYCIVELGSWRGRSAILLGGGSRMGNGPPVICVDFFQNVTNPNEDFFEEFNSNIGAAGLQGLVRAVRGNTAETGLTWTGPQVGLLFIDADHSYESVMRDWNSWEANLAPRATVAFHDYENPDGNVTPAVDELIATGRIRRIEQHDSILVSEIVRGPATR
jgi:MMP 1-O-methyltransferase